MAVVRLFGRQPRHRHTSFFVVAFLAALTAAQNATTTIPPNIIGYYQLENNDAWFASPCDNGREFTSTGGYARCCDNTETCEFVTKCEDSTLSFVNGIYECSKGSPCKTITVYDSLPDNDPGLYVVCGGSMGVTELYRHTTTPGATPSPGPTATTSIPTATSGPIPPSPQDPSPEKPEHNDGSGSKAWIAGAVVGPVAGVAILAGLGFWLYRRNRARRLAAAATAAATAYSSTGPSPRPRPGPGTDMEEAYAPPKYGGAPGDSTPSELPASYSHQRPLSELPTS